MNGPQRLVGDLAVHAAGHLVAVGHEGVDLEVAEAVEVGADARHLCLHNGVDGPGIFVRVDDMRHRQEIKAVLVAEILPFQLPDPVPEDVGGPDRLRDEAEGRVAEDLKRLAGVAHQDAVVGLAPVPGEPGEGPCAEIVVHATVGERFGGKLPLMDAQIVCRDLDRRKEPGKRR